ncbi:MAG: MarR family transcriptional regulator [Polymorphobacter sp.]|uniref:MarR family transcriptional regulator n=1 Tax=Polymorphobacter sp. TaxID=1909290 RepID=UPI003A8B465B
MNAIVHGGLSTGNVARLGSSAATDRSSLSAPPAAAAEPMASAANDGSTIAVQPGDTQDVAALKQRLAVLTRQLAEEIAKISEAGESAAATPDTIRMLLRREIKARRLRERMLPEGLFADPAWDILLDLTLARLEGRQTPVSSLCIAASVPTTTALRWIKTLLERGLIERRPDPDDRRRHYIHISETPFETMMTLMARRAAEGSPA